LKILLDFRRKPFCHLDKISKSSLVELFKSSSAEVARVLGTNFLKKGWTKIVLLQNPFGFWVYTKHHFPEQSEGKVANQFWSTFFQKVDEKDEVASSMHLFRKKVHPKTACYLGVLKRIKNKETCFLVELFLRLIYFYSKKARRENLAGGF